MTRALQDLLAEAKAVGSSGVHPVRFKGRWTWTGYPVCFLGFLGITKSVKCAGQRCAETLTPHGLCRNASSIVHLGNRRSFNPLMPTGAAAVVVIATTRDAPTSTEVHADRMKRYDRKLWIVEPVTPAAYPPA